MVDDPLPLPDADREIQEQAEIMARVHPDHWAYMAHVMRVLQGTADDEPGQPDG